MTPPIERIRFYDGEYLRAFDFQAEQDYHIEMRRRLNMGLHLHGIVEGLDIVKTPAGSAFTFSINSGFAIDAYGREIFVLSPYALDDADLNTLNGVKSPGTFDLWLHYEKTAIAPPENGYASCDSSPELTRWKEGCSITIIPRSQLSDPILPTDAISDEPNVDKRGVLLGIVTVAADGQGNLYIADVVGQYRRYIGPRARNIRSAISGSNTFQLAPSHPRLHHADVVNVDPDGLVANNILVGEDFDATSVKPTNPPVAPNTFPSAAGNLKVASDLFLQGQFYFYLPGATPPATAKWLELSNYVKQLTSPDIRMGTFSVSHISATDVNVTPIDATDATMPIKVTPSTIGSGSCTLTFTLKLASVSNIGATASITGVNYLAPNVVAANATLNNNAPQVSLKVVKALPVGNQLVVTINWTSGPNDTSNGLFTVQFLTINYVVVFYP